MRTGRIIQVLIFLALMMSAGRCLADSEIVQRFKDAFYSSDTDAAYDVVRDNIDNMPEEVTSLVERALLPGVPAGKRETSFAIAEAMADEYKRQTGDIGLLVSVKSRIFDSRLSPPVRPGAVDGVYIVESLSTEKRLNYFTPDNIIIKKGGMVRWVNRDMTAHLLASMPVIGEVGIFSPQIEPGQSWDYRFERSGVYYYICFIHRVMYGKVTVEE